MYSVIENKSTADFNIEEEFNISSSCICKIDTLILALSCCQIWCEDLLENEVCKGILHSWNPLNV